MPRFSDGPHVVSHNFSQLVQSGTSMDFCYIFVCVSVAALNQAAVDGDRWCFSGRALLIDSAQTDISIHHGGYTPLFFGCWIKKHLPPPLHVIMIKKVRYFYTSRIWQLNKSTFFVFLLATLAVITWELLTCFGLVVYIHNNKLIH